MAPPVTRAPALPLAILLAALLAPAAAAAAPAEEPLPEILVSRQLMEAAGLAAGDVVRLAASPDGTGARAFRVAARYEPQPDPFLLGERRHEVRMHLGDLVALRAPGHDPIRAEAVTQINVSLEPGADADAWARDLAARVPGLVARRAVRDDEPFEVLERFHLAIAVVTVLGSSAFLLALMIIRSEERRETAGILRLIGLTRRRILLGGFVEGLLIAVAGAAFGVVFALALQGAFNRFFQWHYDTTLVFVRVTPGIVLRCLALSLPLGVLAGTAASWALLRRNVLALIRR